MGCRKKFSLDEIEDYVRNEEYPDHVDKSNYGHKSNFRRAASTFSIKNSHLLKDNKLVIKDRQRQLELIRDVHCGMGESLASHRGKNSTYQTIAARFFWYNISSDVRQFIRTCEQCQKQGDLKSPKAELKPVPVPSEVMKQVGVDVCNLPNVDGYHHAIVLIDYFSKWSEIKATKDRKAPTIAQFLYEVICRHGCFEIQINNQGREFVDEVSTELHRLTGVEQRITGSYHPQSNGLVERQNRTIKTSLVKVLEDNVNMWPSVIEGVLFAHRVSRHSSTKYSPFVLLYNREPVLPIDVKHKLVAENEEFGEPFDFEVFNSVIRSAKGIRKSIAEDVTKNIKAAQKKQKRNYDSRHTSKTEIFVNDLVLLRNNKRKDRKGGKFAQKWIGPYTAMKISEKGAVTLKNSSGVILKTKYNVSQLKTYHDSKESESDVKTGESVLEKRKKVLVQPMNESASNFWDVAPEEIVESILITAIEQSPNSFPGHKCETFHNMRQTCRRWARVLESRKVLNFLPKVYIGTQRQLGEMRNETIGICTQKINRLFGEASGLSIELSNTIGSKNWKSAWFSLRPEKHSWFAIERIFWKNPKALWLKNDLYHLTWSDREVLESSDGLLNDQLMDAGQKLICKALSNLEAYQSVLNCQKQVRAPYNSVSVDHLQLLHDGGCHWLLAFSADGQVQVCDSLRSSLSAITKKSLRSLFKPFMSKKKLKVAIVPSDRQKDGVNCGLFALAFASIILDGKSPSHYCFKVDEMRDHYIHCLKESTLYPFPAINKKIRANSRCVTI